MYIQERAEDPLSPAFPAYLEKTPPPGLTAEFPRQFSAHVRITSHMVDQAKEYPPWNRELDIAYDNVAERAKVVVTKGLGVGKTFLRLYGSKKEYMIRRGDYPACRRSYLGKFLLGRKALD